MRISIFRTAHFNAAHRLHVQHWSDEKNKEVFGLCNNANYHGHNYELEVRVSGEIDTQTGMLIDLKELKELIRAEVEVHFDHKNINLEVPEEVVLKRLTSRRTCSNPHCQAIYNIYTMPPKKEGICDKCGSSLIQRDDETEEAIKVRLDTYYEKTQPLIDYYCKHKAYFAVPSLDAHETFDAIVKRLQK